MRATKAYINIDNIRYNIDIIKKNIPNSEIVTVLKANAYGHGAIEIANALRSFGIKFLGVAFAEEGVALRKSGDIDNILCIVPGRKADIQLLEKYNIQTAIFDINILKYYSDYLISINKTLKAHLFINTGMNRDGIKPEEAVSFMQEAEKHKGVEIIGLMTHFASSESRERSYALSQTEKFNNAYSLLKNAGFVFKYVHSANSGAIANLPESFSSMVRMGLSVYGLMPEEELLDQIPLKPVMELKSEVITVNEIKKGETAGYAFKFIAPQDTKIAIVPIGYGDGYHRLLSNRAQCLIQGKRFPVVGTICMDQILVEIFDDDIQIGDEVVLMGKQGNEYINAYELAQFAETIPYEITTSISSRVPRITIETEER